MRQTAAQSDVAEAELAQALRAGPFHLALRAALAARGLALHRVQHRLAQRGVKVGITSLSYWQQGARTPRRAESLRAVRALEDVLELPVHALTRLLEPALRPGTDRPAARSYRTLHEQSTSLARLIADLGSPIDGGLHTVCHLERIQIGARQELYARESQHVVRAHRDGVDRYLAIHQGDHGCDPSQIRVRATDNCRVGRIRWQASTGVLVAELLFDTRLSAGDTHVFSYVVEDGTGGQSTEYFRVIPFAGGQYVLQVRFDPTALPVRCHRFTQGSAGAARSGQKELTLSGHRTVHLAEQGVRPGILGVAWDWS
ncbi:hypothetical protein [Streptomyces zagrosensis]|uniref:XRE family transcriptional regulator n=1 Tax=Streptomyces zagrosensis TaxID=1042984 RepID=A0A7W9Q4R1_9ACTN|nr:hypothetical protein [Streptomyces zagrosensis]MBB5933605.1 hypothetical protein [Streptomyces zagrosensis]